MGGRECREERTPYPYGYLPKTGNSAAKVGGSAPLVHTLSTGLSTGQRPGLHGFGSYTPVQRVSSNRSPLAIVDGCPI